MDASQFVTKIRRLHLLQPATITFTKTGITGLRRLHALMKQHSEITLGRNADVVMMAVLVSNDWGSDQNRTYIVYGLSIASEDWLSQIARDIDRVDTMDHSAKALMSSRTKMQQEAYASISKQVLTQAFLTEMRGWCIKIESSLAFDPTGFPVAHFRLKYDDKDAGTFSIDGWSGRMMQNDAFVDEVYMRPEQMQKLMRKWVERLMESMTKVA